MMKNLFKKKNIKNIFFIFESLLFGEKEKLEMKITYFISTFTLKIKKKFFNGILFNLMQPLLNLLICSS